jgi:hypothetical protein
LVSTVKGEGSKLAPLSVQVIAASSAKAGVMQQTATDAARRNFILGSFYSRLF